MGNANFRHRLTINPYPQNKNKKETVLHAQVTYNKKHLHHRQETIF